MAVKYFKLEDNQVLWNKFEALNIEKVVLKNSKKWENNGIDEALFYDKARQSTASIKKSVMAFERVMGVCVEDVNVDELREFMGDEDNKNYSAHVNSFMIACINYDLIILPRDVRIELIPDVYKKLV